MHVWLCLASFALATETVAPAPPPEPEPKSSLQPEVEMFDLDEEVGVLPDGAVGDTLKKNSWAVQDCVTRLSGGGLAGRMLIEWEVTPTGAAQNVKVKESELRNPLFEQCMVSAVKRMKFPAAQGGNARVSHPFAF